MSDAALGRRVLREHRRLVVPLAIALLVNILVYALLVSPLAQRVANIAERDAAAERTLLAARKEQATANASTRSEGRARDFSTTGPIFTWNEAVALRIIVSGARRPQMRAFA